MSVPSQTPLFHAALQEYYAQELQRSCRCKQSDTVFVITEEQEQMYQKLSLPLPLYAPHVRLQLHRAYMGGIELFIRETINKQAVISMYDPDSPARLIHTDTSYSDEFDASIYALPANDTSDASFFDAWHKLSLAVPRAHAAYDPMTESSQYVSYEIGFANSYASYGGVSCNAVLYADMCIHTSNSVDVANTIQNEWCYECTNLFQCSHTFFSDHCTNCLHVSFSLGCRNCSDCFGCVNLQQKSYCFFNQQLTREEYEEKMKQIDLSDNTQVAYWQEQTKLFWNSGYYCAEKNTQSEHSQGDNVVDSQHSSGISLFQCKHVHNGFDSAFVQDACDMSTSSSMERSANSVCCTNGYENYMCISCDGCSTIEYSESCLSCDYCFGCIGLQRKKFCIFNVQYTETEYWKRVDAIKTAMLRDGTYGSFFPYQLSLFAYNTSHAQMFFPLSREEVQAKGGRWYTAPIPDMPSNTIPDTIDPSDDSITQTTYTSTLTGRPYRIAPPELEFHRKMNLALPKHHPSERRARRYKQLMGLQLYPNHCSLCSKDIVTQLAEAENARFLCEPCYAEYLLSDTMMKK